MTPLHITVNLPRTPWSDVDNPEQASLDRLGFIPDFTVDGRSGVAVLLRTEDGRYIQAVTTWRLMRGALRVFSQTPAAVLEDEEDGLS